ncbi:hypothetical protein F4679DRAFT_277303 [Xylaria curta]|nr:hypothetical protein F4679DRAFT_277303 [Xylaria curta]
MADTLNCCPCQPGAIPDSSIMFGPETYEEFYSRMLAKSPVMALLTWLWAQNIPAPIVLLLMINLAVFMQTRSVGNFVHFWRQVILFIARVLWRTPIVIFDLLLHNRLVDSPFVHWTLRFWFGFTIGLFKGLYELFTGRRWSQPPRRNAGPPGSPPPSPPPPLTPPRTVRGMWAQMEWERRVTVALENARDYQRRRRAYEARVAERERIERERQRREGPPPETPDRTGREPQMLRGEVRRWWPRVRIALAVLAVVSVVLGFVYYCQSFEPGDECGWFSEALCGGGGVGELEDLMFDDRLIRQTVVAGQGPPRFRYLNDGTRVSLPY